MNGWAVFAAAVLTVTAAHAAAQTPVTTAPAPTADPAAEHAYAGTMLAAAGDGTITVRISGTTTTVRLLGVGDPGRASGGRASCLRDLARDYLGARLKAGRRVTLVTGADERDAKGRLQAWAYPGSGSGVLSVNRAVILKGLAPVSANSGGLRYGTQLEQAEAAARKARNGRWGSACGLSTLSGIQRRLIELGYLPRGADNGSLDYRTQQAVMAFQGWTGLPRVGTVDRTTKKRLASASRPVPWNRATSGKRIEVHIDRQVLLLIEGGAVKRAIHVSTGAGGRTPRGRFSVIRRERYSWSRPFSVTLPFAQYFHSGFAFHQYPSVPGYAASHGCVRLPYPEAPVVWDFSTYGTPVTIA